MFPIRFYARIKSCPINKETKLVELKSRAAQKICHGNSEGIARSSQNCVCEEEVVEWLTIHPSTRQRKRFWTIPSLETENKTSPEQTCL